MTEDIAKNQHPFDEDRLIRSGPPNFGMQDMLIWFVCFACCLGLYFALNNHSEYPSPMRIFFQFYFVLSSLISATALAGGVYWLRHHFGRVTKDEILPGHYAILVEILSTFLIFGHLIIALLISTISQSEYSENLMIANQASLATMHGLEMVSLLAVIFIMGMNQWAVVLLIRIANLFLSMIQTGMVILMVQGFNNLPYVMDFFNGAGLFVSIIGLITAVAATIFDAIGAENKDQLHYVGVTCLIGNFALSTLLGIWVLLSQFVL